MTPEPSSDRIEQRLTMLFPSTALKDHAEESDQRNLCRDRNGPDLVGAATEHADRLSGSSSL